MSDRVMEILRDALQYARDSTLEEDPVPAWVEEGERLLAEHDAGLIGNLAIQCSLGRGPKTFLYAGNHTWGSGDGEGFRLLSPLFADSLALYEWLAREGWAQMPYDRAHPVGRYQKITPA